MVSNSLLCTSSSPLHHSGKVIGRGGAKIREISAESGARVNILKDEANMSVTPVEISGTPEQQAKAKQVRK